MEKLQTKGKIKMNENEMKIISSLRKNSREQLTDISKKTNIPVSTIHNILKNKNLISKYTCLLDFSKLGFNTKATIFLRIKKDSRKDLQEFLVKNPNTNRVYVINDGFNFMVETLFKNIKDLQEFLEETEEKFPILEKKVHQIIDEIKCEEFLEDLQILGLVENSVENSIRKQENEME